MSGCRRSLPPEAEVIPQLCNSYGCRYLCCPGLSLSRIRCNHQRSGKYTTGPAGLTFRRRQKSMTNWWDYLWIDRRRLPLEAPRRLWDYLRSPPQVAKVIPQLCNPYKCRYPRLMNLLPSGLLCIYHCSDTYETDAAGLTFRHLRKSMTNWWRFQWIHR